MNGNQIVDFRGRIVMVGFGSTGQGTLPLLLRHVVARERVLVIAPDAADLAAAREHGVATLAAALTSENHRAILVPELAPGDLLVNLSVGVSSCALIALCRERDALYLDTSVEPWHGAYTDISLAPATRTNYALREAALALRRPGRRSPTALLTHGANPGLASHFLKQALLDIARDVDDESGGAPPVDREGWAALAERLGIRVVHVAERDTQLPEPRKRAGEFVNTWSVDAFIDEALQPSELGWGSHERHFPEDGLRHESGGRAAIYLSAPARARACAAGRRAAARSTAFSSRTAKSISIAEYLTVDETMTACATGRRSITRITRATTPCSRCTSWPARTGDSRTESASSWTRSTAASTTRRAADGQQRCVLVRLALTIDEARRMSPHNSATSSR